jgi:alpha-1,2-mannosyltransferase
MDWENTLRRHGYWAVSVLILVAAAAYYPRFAADVQGFALYAHGAECLRRQQHLLYFCPGDLWNNFYSYPPFFAWLFQPIILLPAGARMLAWYAVSVGLIVWCYVLCERLARRLFPGPWSEVELAIFRTIAIVLSLRMLLGVLEVQAYDTLVFFFILLGLTAFASGREVGSGTAFGIAAALKATPLIFLPYLVVKRRFLAASVMLLVYVAASFLPDLFFTPANAHGGYYVNWVYDMAMGPIREDTTVTRFWVGANIQNHSLQGVVTRLFEQGNASPLFRPTLALIALLMCGTVAYILLWSRRLGDPPAIDGAAVVIAMIMLSPMSSRSHYVILLLPYVVLAAAWMKHPQTRPLGTVVLAASFILETVTNNDVVGRSVTEFAYHHGFLAWGAMILLIYLAAIVWTGDAQRVRQTNSVAAT